MTSPAGQTLWTPAIEAPTTLAGILPQRWIGHANHWRRIHPGEGERGFYVTASSDESVQRPFYFTTHAALLWHGHADSPARFIEDLESEIGGLLDLMGAHQIESVAAWLRNHVVGRLQDHPSNLQQIGG